MNLIKNISRGLSPFTKDQVNRLPPRLIVLTYDDDTKVTINEDSHNDLFNLCCLTFKF